MRKLIAITLVILLMSSVFAGGAGETAATSTLLPDEAAVYDGIKPLDEETHLVISTHAGTHHGFIVFLIQQFTDTITKLSRDNTRFRPGLLQGL